MLYNITLAFLFLFFLGLFSEEFKSALIQIIYKIVLTISVHIV